MKTQNYVIFGLVALVAVVAGNAITKKVFKM